MIGNCSIPVRTDDIQTIISKTSALKEAFIEKFLSRTGGNNPDTRTIAEDIFNAFSSYSTPNKVSPIVRGVTCRPKYDELAIDIQLFEDVSESIFIELGLAEKAVIQPSYKGVDLNFDKENRYTVIKDDVYLFNPDVAKTLHLDTFINKLKEKVGEDLCKEILLEAKLETAQSYLGTTNKRMAG